MSNNKHNSDNTQEMNESTDSTRQESTVHEKKSETEAKEAEQELQPEIVDSVEMNTSLTELQKKYDTLNDKYLRQYSEFENFRRRTAKEKLDSMHSGSADLVKSLLPVIDDFDRAMVSNEIVDDPEALKEGFRLIYNKLMRILEMQGLTPMDSFEKPFDTEFHDAITNIPAPTDDLKGKVVDVAEKGYFFKDKIIRHAKVVVGQ